MIYDGKELHVLCQIIKSLWKNLRGLVPKPLNFENEF
jgi:hypothetical protein